MDNQKYSFDIFRAADFMTPLLGRKVKQQLLYMDAIYVDSLLYNHEYDLSILSIRNASEFKFGKKSIERKFYIRKKWLLDEAAARKQKRPRKHTNIATSCLFVIKRSALSIPTVNTNPYIQEVYLGRETPVHTR